MTVPDDGHRGWVKSMNISDGIWPTMVTPYTDKNEIDTDCLSELVEWYIEREVDGLFAVCQSSEMHYLSLEEKETLARKTREFAGGRVPVIASGVTSCSLSEQQREVETIAGTGADAVVLLTNTFAGPNEGDEVWIKNAHALLRKIPESVKLGLYECPQPYKRLLSAELLGWIKKSGRFYFLKDTSCDIEIITERISILEGSPFKLFNANASTFLASLKSGAAGFSGVMANFHPQLYKMVYRLWRKEPEKAEKLQAYLGGASITEKGSYPVNAKFFLFLEGIPFTMVCRKPGITFNEPEMNMIRQFREFSNCFEEIINLL
jgi:4-hydroxy-tetrahydrodipicolinate synthase